MSSGYVTTNIPRKPDQVRVSGQPISVNLPSPFPGTRQFSLNDYVWPNPVTSYRSGPSFERAQRKPGAIVSDQNLNEFLAANSGDFGHDFSMRRVTRHVGKTVSRRPDPTLSVIWDQINNPVPTLFGRLNSNVGKDEFIDPTYGFVKSNSDLVTLGTSFIKSTNPIQSQVNLLSDIAEAITSGYLLPELLGKQIISSLVDPKKRGALIRSLGGEYLNFIFGFKPLADDIAKIGSLLDYVNDLVNQWIKDNGTIVRRRRKIPQPVRQLSNSSLASHDGTAFTCNWLNPQKGNSSPVANGLSWNTSTQLSSIQFDGFKVANVTSEITFSAGYKYDLTRLVVPFSGGGSAEEILHSAALRGELDAIAFGLDPASLGRAVYDAIPFSWLLDWFVNLGDVIDNFRQLQARGVQMLWGYITETATRDFYFEHRATWLPTGKQFYTTYGLSAQKAITRVRATPFGFGTSFSGLTGSQSAILAALAAQGV